MTFPLLKNYSEKNINNSLTEQFIHFLFDTRDIFPYNIIKKIQINLLKTILMLIISSSIIFIEINTIQEHTGIKFMFILKYISNDFNI